MPKLTLIAAVFASLIFASAATAQQYILKHPKHEHCRAHYVRKVEHVKVHKHRRREVVCVKTKAKSKPVVKATAPRAVKLKAHLDPSFTRDPSNPFKVTYAYSASATVETAALAHAADIEPAPLPEGVLSLYNDGLLACSINVGGTATGGECPVTYKELGTHTVTTIYQSGKTSATETSVETIEPIKTVMHFTATYAPLAHSVNESGLAGYEECSIVPLVEPATFRCTPPSGNDPSPYYEECHKWTGTCGEYEKQYGAGPASRWLIGYLTIGANVTDEQGDVLGPPGVTDSHGGPLPGSTIPVYLDLWGTTPAEHAFGVDEPITIGSNELTMGAAESLEARAAWSASGYVGSEATVPVKFTPTVTYP